MYLYINKKLKKLCFYAVPSHLLLELECQCPIMHLNTQQLIFVRIISVNYLGACTYRFGYKCKYQLPNHVIKISRLEKLRDCFLYCNSNYYIEWSRLYDLKKAVVQHITIKKEHIFEVSNIDEVNILQFFRVFL